MLITTWPNLLSSLTRKSSVKAAAIVILLAPVLLTVACGGGSSHPPAPLPVSVQVTPPASAVVVGQSLTFAAVVTNSTAGVTWSVQEGAAGGTVTPTGVYTAPMKASTYHVIATSVTDPSKSAAATVGVTAPTPTITSAAPLAANEGDVYTYAMTATDPVGTTISFSLVSGPDGAQITGNTLTWTPTHDQSRVTNAFQISAATSAGGSATQRFTVTPLGTIRGMAIDTYVTAQGNVTAPEDLTMFYIGASVPIGNTWRTIDAVASEDTFEIHGVPAGNYWLAVASGGYWTSASDIDLGQDFLGRNDGILPTAPTYLALDFTGLQEWGDDDSIQIFNPNLNQSFNWSDSNSPGDTSSAALWDWTEPLSDSGVGDAWYVSQVSEKLVGDTSWHYLANSAPAIPIIQADGSTTDLKGALTTAPTVHIQLKTMGSEFAALAPAVGSGAEVRSTSLGVYSQAFTASKGWIGFVQTLLESDGQEPIVTDVDAGDVSFGNPFPANWTPFVSLGYELTVPYMAYGASIGVDVPAEIYVSTTDLPTAGKPLAPVLTPVQNVRMDGSDVKKMVAAKTLSPTLEWDLPATGVPTGYRVTVYQLYSTGIVGKNTVSYRPSGQSNYQPLLDLFTKDASVTVPEGVLAAGNQYFFSIRAYLAPGVDFTVAPYHASFPWAHTDTLTPVFSTGGDRTPATSAATAIQRIARPSLDPAKPRPGNVRGPVLKAMPHRIAPSVEQ